MFYVKVALPEAKLDEIKLKLQTKSRMIDEIKNIPSPSDNYRLMVVLKYKNRSDFKRWMEYIRTNFNLVVAEVSEHEFQALFFRRTKIAVDEIMMTMRVSIAIADPKAIEATGYELARINGVLSVYQTSGEYPLEVTIQGGHPLSMDAILQRIWAVPALSNAKFDTKVIICKYPRT